MREEISQTARVSDFAVYMVGLLCYAGSELYKEEGISPALAMADQEEIQGRERERERFRSRRKMGRKKKMYMKRKLKDLIFFFSFVYVLHFPHFFSRAIILF